MLKHIDTNHKPEITIPDSRDNKFLRAMSLLTSAISEVVENVKEMKEDINNLKESSILIKKDVYEAAKAEVSLEIIQHIDKRLVGVVNLMKELHQSGNEKTSDSGNANDPHPRGSTSKKQVGETIKCHLCEIKNPNEKSFKEHIMNEHTAKPDTNCYKCGIKFKTIGKMKKHNTDKHPPKRFDCYRCGKKYESEQDLNDHIKKTTFRLSQM